MTARPGSYDRDYDPPARAGYRAETPEEIEQRRQVRLSYGQGVMQGYRAAIDDLRYSSRSLPRWKWIRRAVYRRAAEALSKAYANRWRKLSIHE